MEMYRRGIRWQKNPLRRFFRMPFVCCLLVSLPTTNLKAFSLLGPYVSWMDEAKSYRQYSDIGGPMNIGEGYRWNVPFVSYGFDKSFLEFFGSNGVTAVESAIEVLNSLPPASQIALTNYSTSVFRLNFRAVAQNLIDLKSETLFLLLQHLGLAEPQRFAFCLRDSIPANGDFVDTIIQRNFDPFTLQTSSNVNDVAFTDFVWHNAGRADAYELAVDPLMSGRYPAVADGSSGVGGFFVGLSRDDVGGLRYLLDTNNIKFETLPAGVHGFGTNSNAIVDGALRPGVDKITFVRHPFDSSPGQFVPMTNQFMDIYMSNGAAQTQQLERIVTRPDFLFVAGDVRADKPVLPYYSRTGTSSWVNNAPLNGNAGGAGPGTIEPPVTITFNKLGAMFQASSPGADDAFSGGPVLWGTFDGTTNAPLVYPVAPVGTVSSTTRLWVVSGSITNQSSHSFEWTLSGPTNTPFIFQTSTDLMSWKSLATNSNDGTVFTYFQWFPTSRVRFYRVVPE